MLKFNAEIQVINGEITSFSANLGTNVFKVHLDLESNYELLKAIEKAIEKRS